MSTIFSYDNSLVVAVKHSNYQDLPIEGLKVAVGTARKILLSDENGDLYTVAASYGYKVNDRTGIQVDIASTVPVTAMSDDTDVFEFYFRMADGKTVDDLTKGSFRIESDKGEDSILASIYNAGALPDAAGLKLTDKHPSGDTTYKYTKDSETDTIKLDLVYTNSDVQKLGSLSLGAVDAVEVSKDDQTTKAPAVNALDTEGDPMTSAPSVSWSYEPAQAPAGITYNGDGTITVNKEAQTCEVTVTATADGISGSTKIQVNRAAPNASSVEITDGEAALNVPADKAPDVTADFNATVKDQFDVVYGACYCWRFH